MRRPERSCWRKADAFAAVAAVFRRKNKLLHYSIVVALGPAIVAPGLQKHQLFGRLRGFLFRLVEIRPIRMQLVSPVLSHEHTAAGVDGKAFGVAYPRSVAFGRRKRLVRFVRVVTPDAAAGHKFGARVCAGRFQLPIL